MPADRSSSAAPAARRGRPRRAAADPLGPPPRLPSTRANRGHNRRNLVNDNDQQAGGNDARIMRLIEAQEEETRLREEAEQAAEEEEEAQQQDAELAATLARVAQLKVQKAERDARRNTLTSLPTIGGPQSQTTVGSALGIEGPQSQTLLGSSRQGESSLVSVELFERYPAIDEMHLKAIKENTFKPINVVKLTTEMVLDRNKVKLLAVGSDVAVEAREEDAVLGELKGLSHLIRCFLIYTNILVHFAQESLQKSLWIGMLAYVEQLWSFSSTSTFESVRQYHFLFHSMRIRRGIDDGALWGQGDSNLERRTLRLKPQTDHAASGRSRYGLNTYTSQPHAPSGTHPSGTQQNQPSPFSPTCHRWNAGTDCYEPGCKFRHACAGCNGSHRAKDCRVPNRTNERQPGPAPNPAAPTGQRLLLPAPDPRR